jgi:methionyl-tRNA synthetase
MKNRILVTSALPYANGPLHLGHMLEYIQTDIFVRFQRSIGRTCHYVCADDAHGTPIMLSAQKQGVAPEDYIQTIYHEHRADFEQYHVQFDYYGQTHCEANRVRSEQFFQAATQAKAIYKKTIVQMYCAACSLFLPDRLVKGTCPKCQAPDQYGDVCEQCGITYKPSDLVAPQCSHCSATPILKDSEHYFFSLKSYQAFLENWLDQSAFRDDVKNKLSEWFDGGLNDWDISREGPYFGFKIPGSDQYFYVWVDAPFGYMAMTDQLAMEHSNDSALSTIWFQDSVEIHHFIGKDILYFHGLFWPAMLSVLGANLPTQLHVHGFLTVNGEKMSKSRGTFILAHDFAQRYEPELLRYYYAVKLSGDMRDIDFNDVDFVHRINADVLGKFVNIGSRTGSILKKSLNNELSTPDAAGAVIIAAILDQKHTLVEYYNQLNYNKAMSVIMRLAEQVNGYIHEAEPWALVKTDPVAAQAVCTTAIHAWRYLAIYLQPVLPELTGKIKDILAVDTLTWVDLEAPLTAGHRIQDYYHIIKRIEIKV